MEGLVLIYECDTSDCWSFLFFHGGSAQCSFKEARPFGVYHHYRIVGQCTGGGAGGGKGPTTRSGGGGPTTPGGGAS